MNCCKMLCFLRLCRVSFDGETGGVTCFIPPRLRHTDTVEPPNGWQRRFASETSLCLKPVCVSDRHGNIRWKSLLFQINLNAILV